MELKDYAVNGAERYHAIEVRQYDGRAVTQNCKMWTLTIHEPHCRFARKGKGGTPIQDYFGSDGLQNLAARGLTPPTSQYVGSVWQGCKVCGTVRQSNEYWKACAQEVIDAEKAAAARYYEQRKVQDVIDRAKSDYEKAQRDAAIAWQEAHAAEIDGVRLAAAAEWVAANPERAKLLDS